MRDFIKRLLRESFINERLTDVDSDVDLIYDRFFKEGIDKFKNSEKITRSFFMPDIINTSILQSEESKKAHQLNPCKIVINAGSNYYNPIAKVISFSVNDNALNYVFDKFNGDFNAALESLKDIPYQYNNLQNDFNETRIKGSIHHELAHWIDDTMNKQHIERRIEKQMKADTRDLKGIPVNTTKMEIQGQIHNIKQTYNKHKDIWNDITFDELVKMVPTLNVVLKPLNDKFKKQWIRDIKTRMYREIMEFDVINEDKLSDDEKLVLDMILKKYSYDTMASKIGKSKKEIADLVRRVFDISIVPKTRLLGKKMV